MGTCTIRTYWNLECELYRNTTFSSTIMIICSSEYTSKNTSNKLFNVTGCLWFCLLFQTKHCCERLHFWWFSFLKIIKFTHHMICHVQIVFKFQNFEKNYFVVFSNICYRSIPDIKMSKHFQGLLVPFTICGPRFTSITVHVPFARCRFSEILLFYFLNGVSSNYPCSLYTEF